MERPVRNDSDPGAVVFILELADDLFNKVFEGDDAGGASVLVGDDGDLETLLAQNTEQRINAHGLGDAQWRDHQVRGIHGARGRRAERRKPA